MDSVENPARDREQSVVLVGSYVDKKAGIQQSMERKERVRKYGGDPHDLSTRSV